MFGNEIEIREQNGFWKCHEIDSEELLQIVGRKIKKQHNYFRETTPTRLSLRYHRKVHSA